MKIDFFVFFMKACYMPDVLHTSTLILIITLEFCITIFLLHIERIKRSHSPKLNSLLVVTELAGGRVRILT